MIFKTINRIYKTIYILFIGIFCNNLYFEKNNDTIKDIYTYNVFINKRNLFVYYIFYII